MNSKISPSPSKSPSITFIVEIWKPYPYNQQLQQHRKLVLEGLCPASPGGWLLNLVSPAVLSGQPPSSFATNWTAFLPQRHVCWLIHHCLSGSCLPSSFPPTLREHFILFVCSLTQGGWCTRPGKPFRSRGSVQERPPLSFAVSRRSAAARGRGKLMVGRGTLVCHP